MSTQDRDATWRSRLLAFAVALSMVACAFPCAATGLVGARSVRDGADPAIVPQVTGAVVSAVHVDNRPEAALLSFDLSQQVAASAFVLADPDRVIIDLPQVAFSIDAEAGKLGSGRDRHIKRGLIDAFRFGLLAAGRSRIVIDLAQPARVIKAAVIIVDGRPRLELSLEKSDRASFQAAVQARPSVTLGAMPQIVPSAPPFGLVSSANPSPANPSSANPSSAMPSSGKPTVVIDPGHGGPDMGAIVNGVVEKDVTLNFAKMLASRLEAGGLFDVVMTRSNDVFIPLSERVGVARRSGASLMISIHADTLPETTNVSGATVYTVSDRASDAYAAKVAAKENEADSSVGIDKQADAADVNDILFDLTRQETRAYSHVFARTLVNYWKVAGRLNKNPQRAAGFVVLKAPDVPSVLLELGYLSNPGDAATLTSDAWRETATERMAAAIEAYFADQRGTAKAAAGVPIPLSHAALSQTPLHQADAAGSAAR